MRYVRQGILLSAALAIIVLIVMQVWHLKELLTPLIVSAIFSVVVDSADALIWRRVALKSPDRLPTFYTSVSGFRMLLALAVMLTYYLATSGEAILQFFLVFIAFYVMLLVHHVRFFSRTANK